MGIELFLAAVLALPTEFDVQAECAASGVEQLMTAEEYREAGLDKLGPEELAALNRWLAGHRSRVECSGIPIDPPEPALKAHLPKANEHAEPIAAPAGTSGIEAKPRHDGRLQVLVRTRIDGSFGGWKGKTRFKLENGEIWRQRTKGHYVYRAEYPEVEIYENRLGFAMLKVVATGRSVGVTRVQ